MPSFREFVQNSDKVQFSSVQFSHSVLSDSLRPHESQHTRSPCPSPSPGGHSDSRPSSPWCHSAISSSVVPFSSYPQSLPVLESFPMNQLFSWVGQSTGASASASFLPKKSQGWSPSEWTGWNSTVQGTLKSLLQYHRSKASVLQCSASFIVQLSQAFMTTGKTIALIRWAFVGKVMSLLFNMLPRLVIAFLSRNKCLNFMAAVIICNDFGAQENKVCHGFHCLPVYLPWGDGTGCHDLRFLNVEL